MESRVEGTVELLGPQHIQHRYQALGHWQIRDFPSSRRSVTLGLADSGRLGSKFANASYRYTFDGVGYARRGEYLRVDGSTVPTSEYDEQRASAMAAERDAPVVVRYDFHDGLTLGGNTRFHKDRIAATRGEVPGTKQRFSFKWSRHQGFWYLPRSRETSWSRGAVEHVAQALRDRGVGNVEVAYHSPTEHGLPAPREPELEPVVPTPYGWPPLPLEEARASLSPKAQVRMLPRYRAQDYRWHTVVYDAIAGRKGYATNVEGHFIELVPPSLSPFWVLVLDGERVGRGEENVFVLAHQVHAFARELEPVPEPETVDPQVLADARARVADRKARSQALDDAARSVGTEVCPKAIYTIAPAPVGHAEIKRRAEAFAELVGAYRDLHELELWATGKRSKFPAKAATSLNDGFAFPDWMDEPNTEAMTLRWARGRYQEQLETAVAGMSATDPDDALRVLDTCVRDIAGGRRRARAGRAYPRPAEELDLLSRVQPPAPARPRTLVDAWKEHQAAKPPRPWTNVEKTSCFVRNDPGVAVTLCPTPQKRPVATCPPMHTEREEKSKRVMVCRQDDPVMFFADLDHARIEGSNMAIRDRVAHAPVFEGDAPPAEDFAAQERYLDVLVPARLVFHRDRPFKLLAVEVAAPRVETEDEDESTALDRWGDEPLPVDVELVARVRVGGAEFLDLEEFAGSLGGEWLVYRGTATQDTIAGLLRAGRGPGAPRDLESRYTANDVAHGVFGGRSLYWLGEGRDMIGPVLANGKPAPAGAKNELLGRIGRALPLPEALPFGWTFDDTIVISALSDGGELVWSAWNSNLEQVTRKHQSAANWTTPADFPTAAYVSAIVEQLTRTLAGAPAGVEFRVRGPWLGLVFPPDYGRALVFEPPTGGSLDLDALTQAEEVSRRQALENPDDKAAAEEHRRAKRRLTWATKYAKGLAKPDNERKQPKRAPKPKPDAPVAPSRYTPAGEFDAQPKDLLAPGTQLWDKRKQRRVLVHDDPKKTAATVQVRTNPRDEHEKPKRVRVVDLAYLSPDDEALVRAARADAKPLFVASDGDWLEAVSLERAVAIMRRAQSQRLRWLAITSAAASPGLWWDLGVRVWTSPHQLATPRHQSSDRVADPYPERYWPTPRNPGPRSLEDALSDLAARETDKAAGSLRRDQVEAFYRALPDLVARPARTPTASHPTRKPEKPTDANKLRALAAKMEAKANEELAADRRENTPRRARMAGSIRDRARKQLVLARTLHRIADASEAGTYAHVGKVSSKADLEALESALDQAGYHRRRAEHVFEHWKRADPELRDLDYAEFNGPQAQPSALLDAAELAGKVGTTSKTRRTLDAATKRLTDFGPLEAAEVEALREVLSAANKAKVALPHQVSNLAESLRKQDRLGRLGIVDTPTLRAALHEYLHCCRGHERPEKDDPIAAQKRALRFTKIPGFFPTPPAVVERMLEAAELEPGMRVLEPSAGDGSIALAVRERHPDVHLDLVERQVSLRRLLEAQGFELVGDDFLEFHPEGRGYDRIVMNPPFEKRQDVEHIAHALDLLAPSGRLVAIAAAGLESRVESRTVELRERIESLGGRIHPLPPGSFEPSGTGVSTVMVVVDRPAEARPATDPQPPRSEDVSTCSTPPKPEKRASKGKKKAAKKKPAPEAKAQFEEHLTKPAATPKPVAKKKATKKAAAKKPAAKKPAKKAAAKKPTKAKAGPWQQLDYRGARYRYREVGKEFVVERRAKDGTWKAPSEAAAYAVLSRSRSVCSLAAQTLASCRKGQANRQRVRPTNEQKQAMRDFLGL